MSQREFYKIKEAAALFGVSTSSIRNWTRQGMLKCVMTPGGHRRITKEDFREFARKYLGENLPQEKV